MTSGLIKPENKINKFLINKVVNQQVVNKKLFAGNYKSITESVMNFYTIYVFISILYMLHLGANYISYN